jgi:hypothetical protein
MIAGLSCKQSIAPKSSFVAAYMKLQEPEPLQRLADNPLGVFETINDMQS